MSCLLITTNRTYLKFPLYLFYRHLSTIDYRISNPVILPTSQSNVRSKINVDFSKITSQPRRSVSIHVPPTVEHKQSSPKSSISDRIPFQFPPGNPNDKPKLEHLRFIENQLIQIVRISISRRRHLSSTKFSRF